METYCVWGDLFETYRTLPPLIQALWMFIPIGGLLGIAVPVTIALAQRWEKLRAETLAGPLPGTLVYSVYRAEDRTFDAYWYDEITHFDDDTVMRHHRIDRRDPR